jgi:hypothetical protein
VFPIFTAITLYRIRLFRNNVLHKGYLLEGPGARFKRAVAVQDPALAHHLDLMHKKYVPI